MLKNLKNKKKKRGFTLIELIIVIAIIAILSVLAIPKFGEIKKDANFKTDVANAKTIANVTTTLLAEGATLTSPIDVDSNLTSGNLIEESLQNTPKPKSNGYSSYTVTIDGKSNVIITMTDGSKTTNLFPLPDTEAK